MLGPAYLAGVGVGAVRGTLELAFAFTRKARPVAFAALREWASDWAAGCRRAAETAGHPKTNVGAHAAVLGRAACLPSNGTCQRPAHRG